MVTTHKHQLQGWNHKFFIVRGEIFISTILIHFPWVILFNKKSYIERKSVRILKGCMAPMTHASSTTI